MKKITKYCYKCGKKIDLGKHCSDCSQKIREKRHLLMKWDRNEKLKYVDISKLNIDKDDNRPSRPDLKDIKIINQKILERDCFKCQICDLESSLEIHHVKPISRGGNNDFNNLVALCKSCHKKLHRFEMAQECDVLDMRISDTERKYIDLSNPIIKNSLKTRLIMLNKEFAHLKKVKLSSQKEKEIKIKDLERKIKIIKDEIEISKKLNH